MSGYRKVTITMPPSMYDELIQEAARRKVAGMKACSLSAIVTEYARHYFASLSTRTSHHNPQNCLHSNQQKG
jgi:hypothetical protein